MLVLVLATSSRVLLVLLTIFSILVNYLVVKLYQANYYDNRQT
jgi:hypothetical protein